MKRSSLFAGLAGFLSFAGCTDGGKPEEECDEEVDEVMDTGRTVVGCPDGGRWTGLASYNFEEHNYTCDTGEPISDPFDIDSASFNNLGYTDFVLSNEIREVMGLWNGAGADVSVRYSNFNASGYTSGDGENSISMDPGTKGEGSAALATAYSRYNRESGQASDCDIVFWNEGPDGDTRDYRFDGTAASDEFDVTWILTHELGHCLGIAHSDILDSCGDSRTVMDPTVSSGVNLAALFDLDVEAVVFLYGATP